MLHSLNDYTAVKPTPFTPLSVNKITFSCTVVSMYRRVAEKLNCISSAFLFASYSTTPRLNVFHISQNFAKIYHRIILSSYTKLTKLD